MKLLVTGSAGFIGHHLTVSLLKDGHIVVGVDSLNDYYDPLLKEKRNELLKGEAGYTFHVLDLAEYAPLLSLLETEKPDAIIHLAGQAGVRYSIVNPWAYEQANLLGTVNVFEAARSVGVKRVIQASSSSVYGANTKIPFAETDMTDAPVSLYAATKKASELIGHTYHRLYNMEVAALRFFTVYGTLYRPDMALFSFARNILEEKPIRLFNNGKMKRDFTYVDDIVAGIKGALLKAELGFEVYNLGCDNPVELEYVVSLLEKGLGKEAKKELVGMQPGDVEVTYADISKARAHLGFEPKTKIEEGIPVFTKWFLENQEWLLKLGPAK